MSLAGDPFVDGLVVVIIVMEILHFTYTNVAFIVTQMTLIKCINFDIETELKIVVRQYSLPIQSYYYLFS